MNTARVAATRTATVAVVTEDEHNQGKLSTMDNLEWLSTMDNPEWLSTMDGPRCYTRIALAPLQHGVDLHLQCHHGIVVPTI